MDELRKQLDDVARRVEAKPDALEAMRRRAGRRRVTRQVGTGTLALVTAAGGFALAWNAFQSGPAGQPLVGPSMSPSPGAAATIFVEGPAGLEDEAEAFSARLIEAGHDVVAGIHCADCPVPEITTIRYRAEARAEAESIQREFLPGAALQAVSWPAKRGDIYITLRADYDTVAASAIQVRILDGSLLNGAADAARTILEGEGYEVVDVRDAGTVYERTFISCAPQHETEAALIQQALFPKAEIRVELPDEEHDVTVHIGPDFYDDYAGEASGSIDYEAVPAFLDEFVKARGTLGDARQFLSPDGYTDYFGTETEQPGPGAPHLFNEGRIPKHRILKFDKVDADTAVVELWMVFLGIGDSPSKVVVERLRIELAPSGAGRYGLWVTSAILLTEAPYPEA